MKLTTAAEMRELDRRAIEGRGIPGLALMEAAGGAATHAVRELLPDAGRGPVVIVAGKGNNGGDGFVVTRLLYDAGVPVEVCLLTTASNLSGDAAVNCNRCLKLGVTVHQEATPALLQSRLATASVIVDAALGTGLSGQVRGLALAAIEAINASTAPVVAVDIPSGIDADTGAILGAAVRADVTVTFGLSKIGMHQFPGREYCGQVRVADIGIPSDLVAEANLRANLTEASDAAAMLPPRPLYMHKGVAGRLLVVAGSVGMTGAATLASLAAMRSGVGLVYLACPESLNDILEVKCTEVMTQPLPETDARSLAAAAEGPLLDLADEMDAVVIGPGLSQHPETAEVIRSLALAAKVPLVIDADGLNAFADRADELAARAAPTVMTPHPGEMSRLTGLSTDEIADDRCVAARMLATVADAVVVLKGAGTVIAAPDGEVWINPTGNQGLASGGAGDVLAGMVGALLAGGSDALPAAVAGAWYHGRAADEAASGDGRGLIASDLLAALSLVFPLT